MSYRVIRKMPVMFGVVTVQCRVYVATEDHDRRFNWYHAGCGGRIGLPRICKTCNEVVEQAKIVNGTECDDKLVFVTAEELKALEDEGGQIEVIEFVPAAALDPIVYDNPFFLEPQNDRDIKSYSLLRQAMAESKRVGIVQFTLRSRTHLGILRGLGNVLVLHTMRWSDEVRDPTTLTKAHKTVALDPKELKLAHMLIKAMTVDKFDPAANDDRGPLTDTYSERVQELIAAKAADAEFATTKPEESDGTEDVSDLLAKLEKSIARHPAGKARPAKAPAKTPARKRTPAA